MERIADVQQFQNIREQKEPLSFFLFYTDSSEDSVTARSRLEAVSADKSVPVRAINAKETPVHAEFGIDMVPALLIMRNGKAANVVFGLQTAEQYEEILDDATRALKQDGKPQRRVVVYTSDGCPWCDKAKNHLRKNGIPFREVNVSRNPDEAQRLVARTGQRGTPQLDINGRFVVGFDQPKIDSLLGLS